MSLSEEQNASPESLLSAAEPTPPQGDLSKVLSMFTSDPMGTLKKVGSATLEEGRRIGEGVLSAAALPGDVATGKTNMQQPEAQQRVMDLASLFGFREAPGGKGGIAAPAIKEGEKIITGGPNHGAVREGAGLAPETGQPGFETTQGQFVNRTEGADIAKQTGQAKPDTGAALHSENLQNTHPQVSLVLSPVSPSSTRPIYRVMDSKGNKLATVHGEIEGDNFKIKLAASPAGKNTLGPAVVRAVSREIQRNHPEIKTISGWRATGARKVAGKPSDANVPIAAGAAETPTVAVGADVPTKPAYEGGEAVYAKMLENIGVRERAAAKLPGARNAFAEGAHQFRKAFMPQTMDASAGRAAAAVRQEVGRATRDSERTRVTLEQFQKQVNAYDPQSKLDIIDWIQNYGSKTKSGYEPAPEVKPLLDSIRQAFENRRMKLENAPSTEKMQFVEDYFPQMWKDPNAAREFVKNFGTREGSGGFTKQRKIPTVADGIRAGLVPVELDPIGATLRYVENVDRYLATNAVFDTAIDAGDVIWRAPGQQPAGWEVVNTARKRPGEVAYAPEGWATVYNHFVSKAANESTPGGYALTKARQLGNWITAFKLSISGFHALNIAGESMVSGLANAIDEVVAGHPLRAAKAVPSAFGKFITSPIQGAKLQRAYLHGTNNPELERVVSLATDANFRVAGKGRVADEYRFTGQGSLWNAYRKGALRTEMGGLARGIGEAPITGAAKALGSIMARTLETISDPLFKHYIPAVKNGAYYDMLTTWLDAHPGATREEQVAFARKASDIIDDRFGEMNQDNIFWERMHKQIAQAALTSYSYQMGTLRSFGGAVADIAKTPLRMARGEEVWTPKMSYVVALPIVVGTVGAIYQYLKTGKPPQSLRDLADPQTGGVDATSGKPERAVLPSYLSQLMNFYQDPAQELLNKANGSFELAHGFLTGKDWRGDPIASMSDNMAQALVAYLGEAMKAYEPISVSNRTKIGSNIGTAGHRLGIRAAPLYATDPEGYARIMRNKRLKEDEIKAWHDALDRARYGDTQ